MRRTLRPSRVPALRLPLRGAGVASLALAVLLASAPGRAQPPSPPDGLPETWHAERFAQSDRGLELTHFWSKGRKLRVHTVMAGIPVVTIVNGAHYYAIDVLHGVGVAIERSAKARSLDAKGGRPFSTEVEQILAAGGEQVGTEELGGRTVDVVRVTDKDGRRQAWVTQEEPRLPIRVEVFDRATSLETRADYLGWSRGFEIPDSFFEPDPRLTLERVSYDEYVKRSATEAVGPVPVFFGTLLHGHP